MHGSAIDQLQQLMELDDRVDRFAVGTREGQSIDSALARINHVAFGFRAHKSRDVAVQSSRTFRVVERFHTAIGIITVVASAVFLLCLLLLSVEERRRDIAALRLMGISRATVVRAIVIEAAIVSLIGSVLGAGVGWIASLLVNAHFQELYRTPLVFALLTPQIFAFATGRSGFVLRTFVMRLNHLGQPAFFVGDELFWGNDRLHFVEAALTRG